MQAAQQVHGGAGWFQRKGDFPNARNTRAAAGAAEAAALLREGAPLLQRYLPFWLANLVDRMWLVLLIDHRGADPAVAHRAAAGRVPHPLAHLPLVRPAARASRTRSAARRATSCCASSATSRQRVEPHHRAARYADELYALRTHIQMVRRRLERHSRGRFMLPA